jgi:ABC-type nitrate/sulfonate/bicarbonate transport system substrate-binding protein
MSQKILLAVPDLVSPSYFPAIAAVELGCAADHGLDVEVVLHFPVTDAVDRLREGQFGFVAGSAHALFHNAPDGGGVKLLGALSRYMYWFLVVRSDLGLRRGDPLSRLSGLRIGAAPGPDDGLREMLREAGVTDAHIAPVPGATGNSISFGVTAAEALAAGTIDAFWANGMGAEVALRSGAGTLLVDARRGDGPAPARGYTFAALMATEERISAQPDQARAMVTALTEAQDRLTRNPDEAKAIGRKLFPELEAALITRLIARDGPYYDPIITPREIDTMVSFARAAGMTSRTPGFDDLVSPAGRNVWGAGQ